MCVCMAHRCGLCVVRLQAANSDQATNGPPPGIGASPTAGAGPGRPTVPGARVPAAHVRMTGQVSPTRVYHSLAHTLRARWLWMPALVFAVTRLGIILVIYFGEPIIADNPVTPPYHLRGDVNVIIDTLGSRWDTGFYVSIVEEGYKYRGVVLPSVPFFPLMPLAMLAIMPVARDAVAAGLIVSNVSLLLASIVLYRLADREWGQPVADRTVWYFLIFPASLFGSAIYSESLFLLTAISALYSARRGHWIWAGFFALLSCLARFIGLVVVPMLVLEWWMQRRNADHSPGSSLPGPVGLVAALAAPLGTAAYMVYLKLKFDDALAFSHGSEAWGRQLRSPLTLLSQSFDRPPEGWLKGLAAGHVHLDNLMDFTFVVVFIALGLALLWRHRWSEGAFVVLGALAPLTSGLLMSQRRYMWALFPAFILLARWGVGPWVDRLVTAVSLVMLALFTALFANGYWVA
jgi:Mannosyltransferase (PIG-V)